VSQGFAEKPVGWKKNSKVNVNLPIKIIIQAGKECTHTDIRRLDLSQLGPLDVFSVG